MQFLKLKKNLGSVCTKCYLSYTMLTTYMKLPRIIQVSRGNKKRKKLLLCSISVGEITSKEDFSIQILPHIMSVTHILFFCQKKYSILYLGLWLLLSIILDDFQRDPSISAADNVHQLLGSGHWDSVHLFNDIPHMQKT